MGYLPDCTIMFSLLSDINHCHLYTRVREVERDAYISWMVYSINFFSLYYKTSTFDLYLQGWGIQEGKKQHTLSNLLSYTCVSIFSCDLFSLTLLQDDYSLFLSSPFFSVYHFGPCYLSTSTRNLRLGGRRGARGRVCFYFAHISTFSFNFISFLLDMHVS